MKKIALILILILTTHGSSAKKDLLGRSSDQKIQIYASFYPLAFLAKEITHDRARVINLAEQTDIHEYQLEVDLKKIYQADLVIYQGAKLESWTKIIPTLKKRGINTLAISEGLNLLKTVSGREDPHTWLSPFLIQKMIDLIADSIIRIAPDDQKYFKQQANILKQKFSQIDHQYQNRLKKCHKQEAIISHDAFNYVSSRYGFTLYPISGISPHDEPSAKNLVNLKKLSQEKEIDTILIEENNIKHFARILAEESNLKLVPINALEKNNSDQNYFLTGLIKNLDHFAQALECSSS